MKGYLAVGLLLVAGFAGGGWLAHAHNQAHPRLIKLGLPTGIKVAVYPDRGGDGAFNYDGSKPPVWTGQAGQTFSLANGIYDFVLDDPDNRYASDVTRVDIDDNTTDVNLQPSYSQARLAALLPAARADAQAALYKRYPQIPGSYSVARDGLFGLGDWYGALLKPADASLDPVRVILQKTTAGWVMAAGDPAISIGQPAHPNIPAEAIEQVDKY